MIATVGLVSTLGFLTTLPGQFVIAAPLTGSPGFTIQSNGDSSGYIICNPNCHVASNSGINNSGSNGTERQPAYRLTVNVPSHPFGASTIGISIATENGHTDQVTVPTAGGSSHTFNISKDQGKWVQLCVNSGKLSVDTCHTYETTGSVSLSAKSSHQ